VDDVIAVEVRLDTGERRYFITWGRIQHRVDGSRVADIVLRHSRSCSLGGDPVEARVCGTLKVAALSDEAPYFYECYLDFARKPIPSDDGYDRWKFERAVAMEAGREISYCGRPGPGLG
jgi:hypothetical protein